MKTQKKDASEKSIWKKRSIFFGPPYWSDLDVKHCTDIMHMEKNVCDSSLRHLLTLKERQKGVWMLVKICLRWIDVSSCIEGQMVR